MTTTPKFQKQYTGTDKENEENVRTWFWAKIQKFMGKLPFILPATAMYYCAMDPKTPRFVKLALFSALSYFVAPIDFIPDSIPVVGYGDDATVIGASIYLFSSYIKEEHWQQAKKYFAEFAAAANSST